MRESDVLHHRAPLDPGRRLMRVGERPAHHRARRPLASAGERTHPPDRPRQKRSMGGLMRESTTLHHRAPQHVGRRLMRVGLKPPHHRARRPLASAGERTHPPDRLRQKKNMGGLMRESTTLHHRAPQHVGRRLMRVGLKPPHHRAHRPLASAGERTHPPDRLRQEKNMGG